LPTPVADDFGDDLFIDDAVHFLRLLAPLFGDLLFLLLQFVGLVAQLGGLFKVLLGDGGFFFLVELLDLFVDFLQVRRARHGFETHAGAGLVDDVDRLVGKAAIGDVAVSQLGRRLQGRVGDLHAMMGFVAVAQTLEDFDRFLLRRRVDDDLLETALQGAVLFDVFAVFIERGGADALDFAAGQGGLEHVAGVNGAFGAAGADQGVQLVDEQDGVLGASDFIHDRLDALFELAAVLGARDHHGQVEHDDALVAEELGNVAVDDHLGQAFDDGGLADAGLAQQHGIVFGAAAEDLDDALDLVVPADDRVELVLPGQLGQVAAEAIQGGRFTFALLAAGAAAFAGSLAAGFQIVSQEIQHLLAHILQFQAQVSQHLGGHALFLAQQAKEKMFGADVVVIEVAGFLDGVFDDFLGPRRMGQLAHRDHFRAALDEFLNFQADLPQIDVQVLQDVGGDARTFLHQPQQNMFGADVFMVKALRLLIGQLHDFARPIGETLIHGQKPFPLGERLERRPGQIGCWHYTRRANR
jgi:hypothetical protein